MEHLQSVGFQNVTITDGFWFQKQLLNCKTTVYAVWERYKETGRFEAFSFSWKEGSDLQKPHFFWDSDVAKWMEAACYIYAQCNDVVLLAEVERLIDLIEYNQWDDGYFNIYHTVVDPAMRFQSRDHHELYCLGHLIEAAVAYKIATGSERFIHILDRYIDLVIRIFTIEKSVPFATPGHEEIELALMRLYRLQGNKKYFDLAMFFLNQRGTAAEDDPCLSWCKSNYNQSHLPVREQTEAFGHAVRACYLYAGMAEGAVLCDDDALLSACKSLFKDITEKKMYITGGIGSSNRGEAFTVAYDVPNDTAYCETCASIALSLFADRMKNAVVDSRYADAVEREMYNGALAGWSLDGTAFFYENPLEINLCDRGRNTSVREGDRFPLTQRQKNFNCSCCPPNITRYIANLGSSVFSKSDSTIFVHQFMSLKAEFDGVRIEMQTEYPLDGNCTLRVENATGKELYIRIPGWCDSYSFDTDFSVIKGYAKITVPCADFSVRFMYDMKPVFYTANPAIRADEGKVALMYGPLVYCAEGIDNPFPLQSAIVDAKAKAQISYDNFIGSNVITIDGYTEESTKMYAPLGTNSKKQTAIKFIPYYSFANRGESDMRVWIRYE